MQKIIVFIFVLVICHQIIAQDTETVQSVYIIDCPTAASLERASFMTGIHAYDQGGILGLIQVGLTDRLMFGISYGGTNIIGSGAPEWNPLIGVNVRYRLFEEQLAFPAISFGYEGQGKGAYVDSLKRYNEKSKGLFVVASKSFELLGPFAIHGGVNYSFEGKDGDKDLNGFIGLEKSINEEIGIFAEYDLAWNDDTGRSIGDGKGYLNAGVKWSFQGRLFIDFVWKNILENNSFNSHSSREIRINYVEYF